MASGGALDVGEIEKGFRAAALEDGNAAFRYFLSSIDIASPQCSKCGIPLKKIDDREKTVVSLLGTGTFRRSYYECPNGHGHFLPCDELIGINGTAYTPGVRFAVSKLAVAGAFAWASETLADVAQIYVSQKEAQRISESAGDEIALKADCRINASMVPEAPRSLLSERAAQAHIDDKTVYIEYDGTGIPMAKNEIVGRSGKQPDGSSKTREAKLGCIFTQSKFDKDGLPLRDANSTSYFGAIETADAFGWRAYSEAVRAGVGGYRRIAVIGDGAKWVWGIANQHFPKAIHIVDMYHAIEHLSELTRTLFPDAIDRAIVLDDWISTLKSGKIELLADKIIKVPNLSKAHKDMVRVESNYFLENADRMRYEKFKCMGLFRGSGVIEAGCKTVIGKRLKQSGMFWSVSGANAIIALRCADLSCNEDFAEAFSTNQFSATAKLA